MKILLKRSVLVYIFYILTISFVFMEITLRVFATKEHGTNAEFLFNKKHRYLLPFPINDTNEAKASFGNKPDDAYRVYDPRYGWSHGVWGTEDGVYFSNDKGWRITKDEFSLRKYGQDTVDYLFIGDSYTHGDPIELEQTWPYLISKKRKSTFANIAVGGYGIDQAILRFKDESVVADTVFFGVVSGDLDRALQPVYNLYLGNNKTKPYFVFSDTSIHVANQPALKTFEYEGLKQNKNADIFQSINGYTSYFYGDTWWSSSMLIRAIVSTWHRKKYINDTACYIRPNSDEFKYCMKIFKEFQQTCQKKNVVGIVVLLDNGPTFYDKLNKGVENPWNPLKLALLREGIIVVDFHNQLFKQYQIDHKNVIHPTEGVHYSVYGHFLISEALDIFLNE